MTQASAYLGDSKLDDKRNWSPMNPISCFPQSARLLDQLHEVLRRASPSLRKEGDCVYQVKFFTLVWARWVDSTPSGYRCRRGSAIFVHAEEVERNASGPDPDFC